MFHLHKLGLVFISCFLPIVFLDHVSGYSAIGRKFKVKAEARILGGKKANPHEFPFQISIRRKIDLYHECGGSIIHERFILTAAHCLKMPHAHFEIRSIADGVMHPAYQPPSASALGFCDAAIITVDRPFIFNDFVKKIKLPPHEYDPKGGLQVTASGWGLINPTTMADYLYKVTLPIVKRQPCTKKWRTGTPKLTVKKQHICAGTNAKGICLGDSGGGLIQGKGVDAMVVGIASETISPCAGPNFYPSIFTNVGSICTWIEHELQHF